MERWAAKLPTEDYFKFQKLFGPAVTEGRREVLCEAAELIRGAVIASPLGEEEEAINDAIRSVADLIDPDKS